MGSLSAARAGQASVGSGEGDQAADPQTRMPGVDDGEQAGSRSLAARTRSLIVEHRLKLLSLLALVAVVVAWQACADLKLIREQLTSSPSGVVDAFRYLASRGTLWTDILVSAKLFGVGLGIAILIGTVGGIAIGWWRTLGAICEPFISMLYAMPIIALLPIILVWFGITFKAQVVMVVLVSVFPIMVSVIAATRQVDPELLRLARSLRGSQLKVMRTIVLPSLVPYLVAGIRLAVGGALIGVVVSEYFLGQAGIGGLIVQAGEVLQTGQVLVGVLILALVSVCVSSLLRAVERRLTRWR